MFAVILHQIKSNLGSPNEFIKIEYSAYGRNMELDVYCDPFAETVSLHPAPCSHRECACDSLWEDSEWGAVSSFWGARHVSARMPKAMRLCISADVRSADDVIAFESRCTTL